MYLGKRGRLRGNIMGKRVDYSARTVISPSPTLDIGQLGVPREIAESQTMPRRLSKTNVAFYRKNYHLVKTIEDTVTKNRFIATKRNKKKIRIGNIVHRQLIEGDYVIFNRQPSLRKESMMAHRVHIIEDSVLVDF